MGRRRFTSLAGAVLCLGGAGFLAAPHVLASEQPARPAPVVKPVLPPCGSAPSSSAAGAGNVSVTIPEFPGHNCAP